MTPEEYFRLNHKDANTRRWWLISVIVADAIFPVYIGLSLLFMAIVDFSSLPECFRLFLPAIITSIAVLPSFAVLYYCAYKKFGNAWLTLTIIGIPIGILKGFFELRNEEWNYLTCVVMGCSTAASLWLLELSLKLVKINQRVLFAVSGVVSSIKKELAQVSSIEELNIVFGELVRKWPQHESMIRSLTNEKKKTNSSSNESVQE